MSSSSADKNTTFKTYLSSFRTSKQKRKEDVPFNKSFPNCKTARDFAKKLLGFTSFHLDDVGKISHRAGMPNAISRQALKCLFENRATYNELEDNFSREESRRAYFSP